MPAKAIKVFGKVQGVWFRASTRNKARELGLYGWVRNEADGSVFVVAEGPEAALEELLNWCRQGPPHARVDRLESQDIAAEGYHSFDIQR